MTINMHHLFLCGAYDLIVIICNNLFFPYFKFPGVTLLVVIGRK